MCAKFFIILLVLEESISVKQSNPNCKVPFIRVGEY
jgi:hypothetical protein